MTLQVHTRSSSAFARCNYTPNHKTYRRICDIAFKRSSTLYWLLFAILSRGFGPIYNAIEQMDTRLEESAHLLGGLSSKWFQNRISHHKTKSSRFVSIGLARIMKDTGNIDPRERSGRKHWHFIFGIDMKRSGMMLVWGAYVGHDDNRIFVYTLRWKTCLIFSQFGYHASQRGTTFSNVNFRHERWRVGWTVMVRVVENLRCCDASLD